MTDNDQYGISDVERILGIKRTCTQEWIKIGFVIPCNKRGFFRNSIGVKSLFSREGMYDLKTFEELLKRGFTRYLASVGIDGIDWRNDSYVLPSSPERQEIIMTTLNLWGIRRIVDGKIKAYEER